MEKTDGSWCTIVDYRELSKVVPPLMAVVPNMVTLLEEVGKNLQEWKAEVDLANAFFSIAISPASQDQFAFTWSGKQYTFQVLPQGYRHSPTICHQMVAADLPTPLPDCTSHHYINDILRTGPSEHQVKGQLMALTHAFQDRGWAVNPRKVQGSDISVQFLGVVWIGQTKAIPEKVRNTIQQC